MYLRILLFGNFLTAAGYIPARAAVTVTVAAALPSTAPQLVNDTLFVAAILNSTNVFRRQHNAMAAIWNTTIAAYAADYLVNDTDCKFAHSGGPYGENLAIGCSDVTSCVDAWGNERDMYDFDDPAFGETTGHFTQLVWKDSTTVGCGRRLCRGSSANETNTGWFLVCEYWPRGNIIGEFGEEVGQEVDEGDDDSSQEDSCENSKQKTPSAVIVAALAVLVLLVSAVVGDAAVVLRS